MSQSAIDLLWWISGGIVALLGLALFIWALVGDRSRGRKRCPKCWYDMSGASIRAISIADEGARAAPAWICPECGTLILRERALRKSRRRYRTACLAILILASAGLIAAQPSVNTYGWWSIAPTRLLVEAALLGGTEHRTSPLRNSMLIELETRAGTGKVSERDRVRLAVSELPRTVFMRDRWPADVPCEIRVTPSYWFASFAHTVRLAVTPQVDGWNGAVVIGQPLGRNVTFVPTNLPVGLARVYLTQAGTKGDAPWFPMGTLPVGRQRVAFDVLVEIGERNPKNGFRDEFIPQRTLWKGVIERSIEVLPQSARPMGQFSIPGNQQALPQPFTLKVVRDLFTGSFVTASRLQLGALKGVAIAVTVDILHDDAVQSTTDLLLPCGERSAIREEAFLKAALGRPLSLPAEPDARWTARVRSNTRLALRDVDADQCWEGEYTVPLSEALTPNTAGLSVTPR